MYELIYGTLPFSENIIMRGVAISPGKYVYWLTGKNKKVVQEFIKKVIPKIETPELDENIPEWFISDTTVAGKARAAGAVKVSANYYKSYVLVHYKKENKAL